MSGALVFKLVIFLKVDPLKTNNSTLPKSYIPYRLKTRPDDKVSASLSWVGNGLDLTSGLLTDTIESYKGGDKALPSNSIPSTRIVDSLIIDGPSMFVGGDSRLTHSTVKPSLPSLTDGNSNPVYMDQQMRTPSTLGILDYTSPDLLHVALDPANSPSAQPESVSVGSNDSEPSEIQDALRASYSLASHPHMWLPSLHRDVSSLPPVTVQDKLHGFGLQGQYVQTNDAVTGNNDFTDDNILQGNLTALLCGQNIQNHEYLSSFAAGDQISLGKTADMHPQMQLSRLSEENYIKHYADQSQISQLPHSSAVGNYNGDLKPRVRARRGQATDPHSIAERLRREKITDRMKNLQELVPNFNKTDKASMLDEIIDYVKFLQLQVKVLSMSRLGAPEAVLPLITDSQAGGSVGLLLCGDAFDEAAFEEEVVKLMESNMTRAIQFLESKGLCLMPLALAAAIPSSKASSSSIGTGLVYSGRETRLIE